MNSTAPSSVLQERERFGAAGSEGGSIERVYLKLEVKFGTPEFPLVRLSALFLHCTASDKLMVSIDVTVTVFRRNPVSFKDEAVADVPAPARSLLSGMPQIGASQETCFVSICSVIVRRKSIAQFYRHAGQKRRKSMHTGAGMLWRQIHAAAESRLLDAGRCRPA